MTEEFEQENKRPINIDDNVLEHEEKSAASLEKRENQPGEQKIMKETRREKQELQKRILSLKTFDDFKVRINQQIRELLE